ncbi:class I adenylate-forming enzyme family protein [Bordetella sp. BOR01]|uniref:class I adenylate-forming enzyme family protein n=1 Tax=Bordetella sp. BOR01 TaxID=2854779 RepID=UPI001C47796E|nr:AMP-binding protein [Bordetella sp. BOR01]MBV7481621.1 AMP-binding protein [Bordetella sp. BOR01]
MNVANWLHARALQTPAAPALYAGAECRADYRAFAAGAAALSAAMAADYGVRAGDRVALYMPNRIEYLYAMYAAWWVGAVVVPINHKLHVKEAAWIAADAEASLLITDAGNAFDTAMLPQGCRELGVDTAPFTTAVRNPGDFAAPLPAAPDALAWLFYTSGTTGRPKGVMLSHGNLMAMALCYPYDVDSVSASDAWLYAAPMSHGAGLYNFMFVRAGARHVVPASRGFDSAEIFGLARQLGNLCLFAAPTMIKRMVRDASRPVAGLRTIVCGGAPMYAADMVQALDVLGPVLAQIYGQGESPMTITAMRKEAVADRRQPQWEARIASVGTAQSCMEVRVVDAAFNDVPAGTCGEVVTRGPAVMSGYWRNPDATRQTLVDGWLRTGDIGFLGTDGFLTLTDRSKDVIISGGTNIYPREVEEVVASHPGVFEVAVVGAPHPEWGEEVVAFVVVRPGGQVPDGAALEAWCRAEMASFKKPRRYVFCAELPKNSYGKILKTELRELARPGGAPAV